MVAVTVGFFFTTCKLGKGKELRSELNLNIAFLKMLHYYVKILNFLCTNQLCQEKYR